MRWEAWPALLAALAWALFLGALVSTYDPGAPLVWLALLVIAGVPFAVSLRTLIADWRKAEWSGWIAQAPAPVPIAWRPRLVLGVALVLLLAAVGLDLLTRPSSFDVQWFDDNLPLTVTHLRPSTGDAWAYLVALGLTLALVAGPTRRLARPLLVSAVSLGAAALFGGVLLVAAGGGHVDAAGGGDPTSCQHPEIGVGVPPHFGGAVVSHADGKLDGRALGTANIGSGFGGVDEGVSAAFDSAWGKRSVTFDGSGTPLRYRDEFGLAALSLWVFHSDETIVADDLGIDLVGRVPLRHCSLVIDGRGAVNGFEALRWFMGAHLNPGGARLGPSAPATSDPGAAMEAWRGTVDYWIQPNGGLTNAEVGYRGLGLASVTIDGQPPAWPVTGLRATLHAWIWFPPTAP